MSRGLTSSDLLSRRGFFALTAAGLAWPALLERREQTLHIVTRLGAGDDELATGIEFGVREANQSAALFGWRVVRQDVDDAFDHPVVIIIGAAARANAVQHSLVVRARCASTIDEPNVLTVGDCRRRESRDGAAVVEWFGGLERFGAGQLNDRFRAAFNRDMSADAWIGWFSVKVLLESALRMKSSRPAELLSYLRRPEVRFDGHKGVPLFFRGGKLVQPVYALKQSGSSWVLDRELTAPEQPGG